MSATETKSDQSEFFFRPEPCKHMKENGWRPIRTHAALRSSRAHVNTVLLEKITISSDFLKDKMKS